MLSRRLMGAALAIAPIGATGLLVWRYRRRSMRVPVTEPTTASSDSPEETARET